MKKKIENRQESSANAVRGQPAGVRNEIARRDAANKCCGVNCFFNKFVLLEFATTYIKPN